MKKMMVLLAAFSRKSASFKAVVSSVSLLILLGVFGCAGMAVHDRVPKGVPKGYVKFYYLMSEGDKSQGAFVSVHSTDNMDAPLSPPLDPWRQKIGWIYDCVIDKNPLTSDNERGCLVAKTPGIYKFVVEVKMYRKMGEDLLLLPPQVSDFIILVQEGMVVPIKLSFRDDRVYISPSKGYVWQPPVTAAEKPIPFKEW